MSDFDDVLNALEAKNRQQQAEHSKTLARIELNKQRYLESMEALKELGCDSVEEAEAKIAELSEQIQEELEDIVMRLK